MDSSLPASLFMEVPPNKYSVPDEAVTLIEATGKMCIRDRNYMMERFLERISLSEYKNQFILKGGMPVSYTHLDVYKRQR